MSRHGDILDVSRIGGQRMRDREAEIGRIILVKVRNHKARHAWEIRIVVRILHVPRIPPQDPRCKNHRAKDLRQGSFLHAKNVTLTSPTLSNAIGITHARV